MACSWSNQNWLDSKTATTGRTRSMKPLNQPGFRYAVSASSHILTLDIT